MRIASCFVAVLLVATMASAQQPAAPAENESLPPSAEARVADLLDQARAASEAAHRYHLETLSCGELDEIAASESPSDQAVVAMLMVWAHGYQSGLKGLNFEARPIDLDSMLGLIQRVIKQCEKTPDTLFHIAVTEVDALESQK